MKLQLPKSILENPTRIIEELEPVEKGDYFLLLCPACDHREAFLYKGSDIIICNRRNKCSYTSNLWDYIKEANDLTDNEVLSFIVNSVGRQNGDSSYVDIVKEQASLELPEGLYFFVEVKKGLIRELAYNYLINRGIPEINAQGLGFVCDPASEYDRSIFIPFYENGGMVYFSCRSFSNTIVKRYNNPHGINSKQFVYNIDKIRENGDIFIFEGIIDALTLDGQIGTAMLSADLGKMQAIKILNKAPKNIIFVPDNDETGKRTLYRNVKLMLKYKPPSLNINIFVYEIKRGKDFNESGERNIDLSGCKKVTKLDLMRS